MKCSLGKHAVEDENASSESNDFHSEKAEHILDPNLTPVGCSVICDRLCQKVNGYAGTGG